MQIFNMGYWNYSQGEWHVARRFLKTTCTLLGFEDGPSAALLRYMEKPFGFKSPPGWRGIHHLDPNGQLGIPMTEQGKPLLKSSENKTEAQREAELLRLAAYSAGPSSLNPSGPVIASDHCDRLRKRKKLNPTGATGHAAATHDQASFDCPFEDKQLEELALERKMITLMHGEVPTRELTNSEVSTSEGTSGEVVSDAPYVFLSSASSQ